MNEIATTSPEQQSVPAAPAAPPKPLSAMEQWAREARAISQIAQSLANTNFVGKLRGKPEEITAVILAGHELGLPPMAALKSIDMIGDTPAMRAHAMRALVLSHGHEMELVESTPVKCVMRGRRKGSEAWQQVEWTIERAAQMKLTEKAEWQKQPQTMLVARATGELSRLIAADILHGLAYVAEELEGTAYAEAVPAARPRLNVAELGS
ncbi:hypothetical protein ACLF6K_37210 [Streptomyces xanthophaeus]|uniref:hypothetical protein n=1 Tax=Streptomyces xanthophaeus TaxID=67385 RepID=UPI0039901460